MSDLTPPEIARPDADSARMVQRSISRLSGRELELTEGFYGHLFAMLPEVRALFPDDMAEQRVRLLKALLASVQSLDDPAGMEARLQALGEIHYYRGIADDQYQYVGHALIRTVRDVVPADWSTWLSSAWISVYSWMIQHMVVGAQRARAQAEAGAPDASFDAAQRRYTDVQIRTGAISLAAVAAQAAAQQPPQTTPPAADHTHPGQGAMQPYAGRSYGGHSYEASSGHGAAGHPGSGYDASAYQASAHPYPAQGHPAGGHAGVGYDPGAYGSTSYGTAHQASAYDAAGYDAAGYEATGYEPAGYEATGYAPTAYEATGYAPTAYEATGYEGAGYEAVRYEAAGRGTQGYGGQEHSQGYSAETSEGQQAQGYLTVTRGQAEGYGLDVGAAQPDFGRDQRPVATRDRYPTTAGHDSGGLALPGDPTPAVDRYPYPDAWVRYPQLSELGPQPVSASIPLVPPAQAGSLLSPPVGRSALDQGAGTESAAEPVAEPVEQPQYTLAATPAAGNTMSWFAAPAAPDQVTTVFPRRRRGSGLV